MTAEKAIKIDNKHTILQKDSDGVIVLFCAEQQQYDIAEIKENHEAIKQLSDGKRAVVLSFVGQFTTVTKEARDFVAKGEHHSFIKAEAFVISSLAHILVAKFYIKINKPKVPTAYFRNQEDARRWLRKYLPK